MPLLPMIVSLSSQAQANLRMSGNSIEIRQDKNIINLNLRDDSTLRIECLPDGVRAPSTDVFRHPADSPNISLAKARLTADGCVFGSASLQVEVHTSPLKVVIRKGKTVVGAVDKITPDGFSLSQVQGDHWYGMKGYDLPGEEPEKRVKIGDGMLRDKGARVAAGRQGDGGAPLAFTTKLGLLVDSSGGNFDADGQTISFTGNSRSSLEFLIEVGGPGKTMHMVADVSGHVPMMPKWAFGFLNSQWGTTQKEVEDIVGTYQSKRIPLDAFILDFDFKAWGEDHYGEFRWNSQNGPGAVAGNKFPDGASGDFAKGLAAKGVKLVGIMKPRILVEAPDGTETEAAKDAKDFFVKGRKPYPEYFSHRLANEVDFTIPAARDWFWQHSKPLYETGIVGWWNDEADAVGDFFFDNFEFADMQRALYEGQTRDERTRVFSINRNFYLGAQRYSYGLWSGDINTGWKTMAEQRGRMLASLNLGETRWSMDTGGFGGHPDPENYARWMEFAAFVPIFRVHCVYGEHRQPWVFGPTAEAAATKAIRLRYRLLPYIYSEERQSVDTGVGLVRPLFYEWPDDPKCANPIDEWMFGDSLLVSPIVEKAQTEKSVYLPSGTWYEFATDRMQKGGSTVTVAADARGWKDIPLYVKEGAIIPTDDRGIENTDEVALRSVRVLVYPGKGESHFSYYDDDGKSLDYRHDTLFTQEISTRRTSSGAEVRTGTPVGLYANAPRSYIFSIHTISASAVRIDGREAPRVTEFDKDGKAPGWRLNPSDHSIEVRVDTDRPHKIEIG